jgi:hypothetical protein
VNENCTSVLLTPRLRRPLIIGIGLAMFQQITGINTVIYFAPTKHKAVAPAAICFGTARGMDTGETATETPPPAMARRYRVALSYA